MAQAPRHIAIIMDGNGRWAAARGLPRIEGHRRGADALRATVRAAAQAGVGVLTVFGFSSENWRRPAAEIDGLMALLRHTLRAEAGALHKNNVRLRVIGDRAGLPGDVVGAIEEAESRTAGNDGLTLVVALNYGGRADIVRAASALAQAGGPFTEEGLAARLETARLPEVDLLIRTSGEQRVSNFLLWPCAYAELYFTDTLWPDFGAQALGAALEDLARRERRFGALEARREGQGS